MVYFDNPVIEKYVFLALTNPSAPFTLSIDGVNGGAVKIINLKRLYDFVAEKANFNVIFDMILKELINLDGCYALPSWMTKSGHEECIYFERYDNIDEETQDVLETVIEF